MGLRISSRGGGIDRHWPRLGAVTGLHEEFVKREFDSGTDDVKWIWGRAGMTDALAVVHGVRDGGSRVEKGRGTKVGRKEGGEAKQGILKISTGCGNGVLCIAWVVVGVVVVGVLVICRIGLGVFLGGSRPGDGTRSASDVVLELSWGLEIRFLYRDGRGGGCRLIDRERELHALDRTRAAIEICLAGTFFLCSALPDDVCWMITLEAGRFQLFDAPGTWTCGGMKAWQGEARRGRDKEALGRRVTGRWDGINGPAFLLVELVTHRLAQSLELSLWLGTVDIDHEVLQVP
jgi:hypothetical protein